MNKNRNVYVLVFILILITLLASCSIGTDVTYSNEDRIASIPSDAEKVTPETDEYKPRMHSDEFHDPVPVEAISSAGAEDSAFIPIDRDELYFMFVKDVREEPSVQIRDMVNGIWVSKRTDAGWSEPELVVLQESNKLALNGAQFAFGNELYFVSAREDYEGLTWFRAERIDGKWQNWEPVYFEIDDDINFENNFPPIEVGEFHIHDNTIYFHSDYPEGEGNLDIWAAELDGNRLSNLRNLHDINTPFLEGWPYISSDGQELWYTGEYNGVAAVYRMKKTDKGWGDKELMVSNFAGEPTLDSEDNLYFTHHYFRDGVMIEADIYVAYRRN